MYGTERPNVFMKMVPNESRPEKEDEEIEEKIRRAYVKMEKRAMAKEKRRKRGTAEWNPELNEKFLVKPQPISHITHYEKRIDGVHTGHSTRGKH
jgi:hypothetical protein